jgi:hypothetical protein
MKEFILGLTEEVSAKEFFRELGAIGGWRFHGTRILRDCDGELECPLGAVVRARTGVRPTDAELEELAVAELGLAPLLLPHIFFASDHKGTALRERMLSLCGLVETDEEAEDTF